MSTSGVLILAKTKEVHQDLQGQFANRTITKRYMALLEHQPKALNGEIDLPLRVDLEDRPRQLVCFEHGKEQLPNSKFWKRQKRNFGSFFPITGRTHQLRVHAAHKNGLNSPIVGDECTNQGKTLFAC